ncbi:MAG: FkbM family methyltransferase, partial [Sphingomonas sp.]|nr:FkbM family methyltransferase [Sphingomonas sp.]
TGNRVRMDGLSYSVSSPNISTGHKSTLAFGLHEMEERELVKCWLPRNLPAIELGGGLGVVSCLTNRLLDDPSQHIVVEANPYMVPVLLRNRDLNGCKFQVVNTAIAYDGETVTFPIDPEFVGSNLAAVGDSAETVAVEATTLAALADFERFSLIADIEGAEADIILRELPRLRSRVRFAMIELHPYVYGQAKADELMAAMSRMGFELLQRLGEGDVFSVAYRSVS